MKKLKPGVTVILPAKNEEPRIAEAIKQFRPYVDFIIVVEDGSTDKTIEIAEEHADKVIQLNTKGLPKVHQSHAYNEGWKHVETEYILVADCDEKWDKGFLENMKKILAQKPEALCFRFIRLNLPDGKDYPDYQVRLVKTAWVIWKEDPHSKPCLRGKSEENRVIGTPLDNTAAVEEVLNAPILHLPRRKDINRPWWNEK